MARGRGVAACARAGHSQPCQLHAVAIACTAAAAEAAPGDGCASGSNGVSQAFAGARQRRVQRSTGTRRASEAGHLLNPITAPHLCGHRDPRSPLGTLPPQATPMPRLVAEMGLGSLSPSATVRLLLFELSLVGERVGADELARSTVSPRLAARSASRDYYTSGYSVYFLNNEPACTRGCPGGGAEGTSPPPAGSCCLLASCELPHQGVQLPRQASDRQLLRRRRLAVDLFTGVVRAGTGVSVSVEERMGAAAPGDIRPRNTKAGSAPRGPAAAAAVVAAAVPPNRFAAAAAAPAPAAGAPAARRGPLLQGRRPQPQPQPPPPPPRTRRQSCRCAATRGRRAAPARA
jgi:hypothetical protein